MPDGGERDGERGGGARVIEIPKNALAEALVHLSDGARLPDVCRHLLSAVPGQRSGKQEARLFFLLSYPFAHTGQRSKTQEAVLVTKISAAICRNLGVSKKNHRNKKNNFFTYP
jgi:hypothetical protein